jgi:hypothetical protein
MNNFYKICSFVSENIVGNKFSTGHKAGINIQNIGKPAIFEITLKPSMHAYYLS